MLVYFLNLLKSSPATPSCAPRPAAHTGDTFNDLMDDCEEGDTFDVMFNDGVLTFDMGEYGTPFLPWA